MIVQGALFFILGIAVTSFVLILVAPLIWRRAMYFMRKIFRSQLPFSIEEAKADRDFLRAQHAVQLARYEERTELLQRINDEQRRQLERNKMQIEQLLQIEGKTQGIQQQLVSYNQSLDRTSRRMHDVIEQQGASAKEVRNLSFSEKLVRLDVATYEQNLKEMNAKLESLTKKYNKLEKSLLTEQK